MLLKSIFDQSGACTFKAVGWKESDQQQFISGNDCWRRDGDMTNPMQQTDIQPLAPLLGMSTTHLTTTSSMPKKKIAIRIVARGPIGKCLESVFAATHRYVEQLLPFVKCHGLFTHY